MSNTMSEFEARVKGRVDREMRAAAAEIKRYDFTLRVEEMIKNECARWSYNDRAAVMRFKQQFESQFAEAANDEAVQDRVKAQIDAAIAVALSESRIRDMVDDWIDEWVEETVREQLEVRLAAKVGDMPDTILADEKD